MQVLEPLAVRCVFGGEDVSVRCMQGSSEC